MQGYDGAIQAWIANLISRRVAPYFPDYKTMPSKEFM